MGSHGQEITALLLTSVMASGTGRCGEVGVNKAFAALHFVMVANQLDLGRVTVIQLFINSDLAPIESGASARGAKAEKSRSDVAEL